MSTILREVFNERKKKWGGTLKERPRTYLLCKTKTRRHRTRSTTRRKYLYEIVKVPRVLHYVYIGVPAGNHCSSPTNVLRLIVGTQFRKMIKFLFLSALVALSAAQFQPQPTGRILEPPIPALCAQRTIHERFNGKGYFYSWADPRTNGQEVDWLAGRNFCRQRCMDLVSLETSAENEYIKSRIVQNKVKYIWTSGRLCDFKGCDRPDLQPLHINGWFWTAELQKLAPTNDRSQNDWSESGGIGKPQPDNREAIQGGAPENCLAVLNQFYNDGVNWHDVACHHKKPWVCEENDSLLKYVRFTNPNLRV